MDDGQRQRVEMKSISIPSTVARSRSEPIFAPNFSTRMRQQRAKRYRKAMALYQTTFKFREPYQVLLSSDFLLDAHRFKLNLASILERTIQGQLKLSNLLLSLCGG
jgi:hypothetical protein